MSFSIPATIQTPLPTVADSKPQNEIVQSAVPLQVMTYEDYIKDIESMCQKDKQFMAMIRKFSETHSENDDADEHSSKSGDS